MEKKMLLAGAILAAALLCACSSNAVTEQTEASAAVQTEASETIAHVDMAALYAQMEAQLPEMIQMDADTLRDYCGIEEDSYVQAVAVVNYNGLETDEVWLIEATDTESAAQIYEMAELRLKMKGEETIDYAPEQYAVVQKAKLIQKDVYIALIVTPEADALAEMFEDAVN